MIYGVLLALVRAHREVGVHRDVGVSTRNVVSRTFPQFFHSRLTPMRGWSVKCFELSADWIHALYKNIPIPFLHLPKYFLPIALELQLNATGLAIASVNNNYCSICTVQSRVSVSLQCTRHQMVHSQWPHSHGLLCHHSLKVRQLPLTNWPY